MVFSWPSHVVLVHVNVFAFVEVCTECGTKGGSEDGRFAVVRHHQGTCGKQRSEEVPALAILAQQGPVSARHEVLSALCALVVRCMGLVSEQW